MVGLARGNPFESRQRPTAVFAFRFLFVSRSSFQSPIWTIERVLESHSPCQSFELSIVLTSTLVSTHLKIQRNPKSISVSGGSTREAPTAAPAACASSGSRRRKKAAFVAFVLVFVVSRRRHTTKVCSRERTRRARISSLSAAAFRELQRTRPWRLGVSALEPLLEGERRATIDAAAGRHVASRRERLAELDERRPQPSQRLLAAKNDMTKASRLGDTRSAVCGRCVLGSFAHMPQRVPSRSRSLQKRGSVGRRRPRLADLGRPVAVRQQQTVRTQSEYCARASGARSTRERERVSE